MTISHQNCLGPDFLNGFATAAYQVEGGYLQDGRGLSVWDVALADKPNGNVACNSYNMMDEDVELLKTLGARVFRFSISWSRIIPKGGCQTVPMLIQAAATTQSMKKASRTIAN